MNHEKHRLAYRQNFRGCMENIAYNLVYVSTRAKRRHPSIRVEVRMTVVLDLALWQRGGRVVWYALVLL